MQGQNTGLDCRRPEAGLTLQPCGSSGPRGTSLCPILAPLELLLESRGPSSKCWQKVRSDPAQATHPLEALKLSQDGRTSEDGLPGHLGSKQEGSSLGRGVRLDNWLQKVPTNPRYSCGREHKILVAILPHAPRAPPTAGEQRVCLARRLRK